MFSKESCVALSRFQQPDTDRKSTRLNSSHLVISYAVFCLKKKTIRCLESLATHSLLKTLLLRTPSPAFCRRVVRPARPAPVPTPDGCLRHHPAGPSAFACL